MTEQVEQWICIKFWVKFEHSSMETIHVIQKAAAMGNWWLAASSRQCTHSCITSPTGFFGETSNHPDDSAPLQPKFAALRLLAFLKTKITFEKEEISYCHWDSGKYDKVADGDWQNYLRSHGTYLKGTEVSLSYVQCFLYLTSSSINVSIFHIIWQIPLDRPHMPVWNVF